MKFDMNAAWRDAMAMLSANKDVLFVVAGLFFFLPSIAVTLLAPGLQQMPQGLEGEAAQQALIAMFSENWPVLVISMLVSAVGVLVLLALLRDSGRPTVGEAIAIGAKAFIPYIAAQLLIGLAVGILLTFVIALGAASAALGVVLGLAAFVLVIYVLVKMLLVAPVIVIDKQFNPIAAVTRAWQLTKGNSLRMFGFFALFWVVVIVLGALIGIVVGVLQLIDGGGTLGLALSGAVSGGFAALYTTVWNGVLAAVHRQLSGPSGVAVSQTFE